MKEKEEEKYFISLYKTLYKFNTNPIKAAGVKGGKYGQTISDAVDSGQTLAGLTEDQQIYMLKVMKNIFYPKSKDQDEEGGSIPNLKFLKSLPKNFINSLNESARSVLESYIQDQDSSSNSSTASTTTTSVSTTCSLEKSFSSTSCSTSEPKTTTALPLGGDPIAEESTSPTVTISSTTTTLTTSHSSTILFSPLDPIVAATKNTSTELTGQNSTADTE